MYATTETSELLRPTRDADRGSFFGKRLVSTVAIALGIACVALAVYAPNRTGLGYVLNYGPNGAGNTIDSTIPAGSNCSDACSFRNDDAKQYAYYDPTCNDHDNYGCHSGQCRMCQTAPFVPHTNHPEFINYIQCPSCVCTTYAVSGCQP